MEIYILDSNFSRFALLEDYVSMVWTERYSSYGEFELVLPISKSWDYITPGRYLSQPGSKSLMIIEEISRITASDGEETLTVRGRSMESILTRRVIAPPLGKETLHYTGPPGWVAYRMIHDIVVFGGYNDESGYDKFKDVEATDRTDTQTQIDAIIPIKSLYEAVKDMCDSHNLGFGMEFREESPRVVLYIEEGRNLSSVYFSSKLDTLTEESYVTSEMDYYNFAYVYAKEHEQRVRVGETGSDDLSKRALPVMASDISRSDPDLTLVQVTNSLLQRGMEELAKHKKQEVFDGRLTGLDPYVYGVHFILGDIVTLMSADGKKQKVRITEYIWASDSEGDRSYPAFTAIP